MIAKKVKPHPKDTYGALAEYIAAAKEKGEKLHSLWMEKFNAGKGIEDLDLAILEAQATQKLNQRVTTTKTYHLMFSFRSEDQIPDEDSVKAIERHYAKALGFEEHQRIVGCHPNTNNFHVHVAYNRIHPKTLRAHAPEWDHYKLQEVSKAMEKKYGLVTDYTQEKGQEKENTKAKDKEAHTWEESFDSYLKRHKEEIKKGLSASENWQEFHRTMDAYDIRFKPRANGLVIEDNTEKNQAKASSLGREFSKKALEEKFGPFQHPIKILGPKQVTKKDTYKQRPITKHPATKKYWKRYLNIKSGQQSLMTHAFHSWKDYLQYEALQDPLAMAIIKYQRQLMGIMLPTGKEQADYADLKAYKGVTSMTQKTTDDLGAAQDDMLGVEKVLENRKKSHRKSKFLKSSLT